MKKIIFIFIFAVTIIIVSVSSCGSEQEGQEKDIFNFIDLNDIDIVDIGDITDITDITEEPTELTTEPIIQESEEPTEPTEIEIQETTEPEEITAPPDTTAEPSAAPPRQPPPPPATEITEIPVITVKVNGVDISPGSTINLQEQQRVSISANHPSGISEIYYSSGGDVFQRFKGGLMHLWYDEPGITTLQISATAATGAKSAIFTYTLNISPRPVRVAAAPPPAAPEAPAETPYVRPGYMKAGFLVAHAMGILDGSRAYTNSLEAFKQNYEAGHRIFEVDLQITADGLLATLHDYAATPSWTFEQENDAVPYTLMTFWGLCRLLTEYADAYIITDTKYRDSASNKKTFDIIRDTINAIDPKLINRIAIQFYDRPMYYFLTDNYSFPKDNYIYTIYMTHDTNRQIVDFVKREKVRAVAMWDHKAEKDKDLVAELSNAGVTVYAHTINDTDAARDLLANGVHGIYTDTLTPEDFD